MDHHHLDAVVRWSVCLVELVLDSMLALDLEPVLGWQAQCEGAIEHFVLVGWQDVAHQQQVVAELD